MAKIIDPDNLSRDVSVSFRITDPLARYIGISSSLENGSSLVPPLSSGSDSGVTFQCLYSFCKEQWKAQADLIKIPFPIISITKNQFDLVNSWDFESDQSRYYVRDAGWSVQSASVTLGEWVGIQTLGTLGTTDQVYYQQSSSLEPATNFVMSGSVNQAIKQFESGSYDKRYLTKIYVREWGKTYDDASIQGDLSIATQEYVLYSLPLTNATDLDIQETNESSASVSPYTEVTSSYLSGSYFNAWTNGTNFPAGTVVSSSDGRWYITNTGGTTNGTSVGDDTGITDWLAWTAANGGGERQIGSAYYPFNIMVDHLLILHAERLLDDGTQDATPHIGKVSDLLLKFLGPTLITSNGVYVDNFQDADTNSIDFYDVSGTVHRFPFVAAGTINFNDNLQNDVSASYWMFFTSVPSGTYGSSSAVIVEDNSSLPITGSVGGLPSVSFTFDYDNNVQGGRTAAADADITVVAVGLNTAQYVSTTATISRSKVNVVTLVSALERNYSNPA